jgi:hypothetical protein
MLTTARTCSVRFGVFLSLNRSPFRAAPVVCVRKSYGSSAISQHFGCYCGAWMLVKARGLWPRNREWWKSTASIAATAELFQVPANVLKIDHVLCDHHERVIRRAVKRFCLTSCNSWCN